MGYLRFFLVVAVLHGHFIHQKYFWQHHIALMGFFVLSGFLITRIVCEVYQRDIRGKSYYLLNRFLRIYPTYYACLLIALVCVLLIPETARHLNRALAMPDGWRQWLPQLTIVGLSSFEPRMYPVRLLGPAWSLSTEIVYYLIIGLVTGPSRRLTLAALTASLVMLLAMYERHLNFFQFYYPIYGLAPVFFLGSAAYHYRGLFTKYVCPLSMGALLALANVMIYMPDILGWFKIYPAWKIPVLHISALGFSLLILGLYTISQRRGVSKPEQFCADISYPMFLLHWPMAAFAAYGLQITQRQGYALFFPGAIATFLAAVAIVFMVEMPMKKIRTYLRHRAQAK